MSCVITYLLTPVFSCAVPPAAVFHCNMIQSYGALHSAYIPETSCKYMMYQGYKQSVEQSA